ncbi:hypothetical protein MNBD_BACTEROID03-893 [hydrothermal vent metagenome]|uniref:Uncharacterized protein n=1 Tax=hydrothermal vent metagenome TaxID=652676 RepID=A0A3B0TF74_9ZZZZ
MFVNYLEKNDSQKYVFCASVQSFTAIKLSKKATFKHRLFLYMVNCRIYNYRGQYFHII